MNVLTLDFETYYAKDYTLSKMTNEEYIRDPRFEAILVGLKADDNDTFWVPGPQIPQTFRVIPWNETIVLSHHAQFDMAILAWIYGIRPRFYADTIPMFRCLYPEEQATLKRMSEVLGLGEKGDECVRAIGKRYHDFDEYELSAYGSYCCQDVNLTHAGFIKMLPHIPLSELELNDMTIRMFTNPVFHLDEALLIEAHKDELARKAALLEKLGVKDQEMMRTILSSNDLFAKLLLELGVDPPKKVSQSWRKKNPEEDEGEYPAGLINKSLKTWSYAFAKDDEPIKLMLDGGHGPLIQMIAEARVGVKSTIRETRMERMINVARRGTLPVYLKAWGAHTGRFGGGDLINLQNLTRSCDGEGCVEGKIK